MRVAAQGATGRTILAGCRPFFDRHGFARQCRLVNVQVASLEELSISRHFSLVSSGWVVRCSSVAGAIHHRCVIAKRSLLHSLL